MHIPFNPQVFTKPAKDLEEIEKRQPELYKKLLKFGVPYLDDACRGILPDDLILLGAKSGVGKTQFCVNLALSNLTDGKRVHMLALEAGINEIGERLAYTLTANFYFNDPNRPRLSRPFNYLDWKIGRFQKELEIYQPYVRKILTSYSDLNIYYKKRRGFDVGTLIEVVYSIAEKTDLIIIDHAHFFDMEENENRALKQIAKETRNISLNIGKPIILVAHLRKSEKRFQELAPGEEEFHGSSDLAKIATKVITLGRGNTIDPTKFETYVRIAKCRADGSLSRYVGVCSYNIQEAAYETSYQVGHLKNGGSEFEPIQGDDLPYWAKRRKVSVP